MFLPKIQMYRRYKSSLHFLVDLKTCETWFNPSTRNFIENGSIYLYTAIRCAIDYSSQITSVDSKKKKIHSPEDSVAFV